MAVTSKWRQHIEAWQSSGITQVDYCRQYQLNVRTFGARLSDYRKLPQSNWAVLNPVQVEQVRSDRIVFTHAQGHRLELPVTVSARWLAELLKCLA
ncbi:MULTISPECIES: IS66 family insertion sequence element accessory protein TnpA [Methylomonas]|uniref:IS66 family insertion sequence element accessory protein TnpA n=1 Tax=Methylomonas TaxID=416 RepID=UPI001231DD37|nr:IS66 family insertion sequence element accessory protein TnpB [Methylomonas rhizoryzae]